MPTNRSTVYSTQITHIGSGASMAAGVMSGAADVSVALASTNLGRYPLCDLSIKVSNTASVSSASNTVLVYRRDINFDGANDMPVPSTATSTLFKETLVGSFTVPAFSVASTSYHKLCDIPLADECEFYLENKLNTAIGLGWTLLVTPKTDSYA